MRKRRTADELCAYYARPTVIWPRDHNLYICRKVGIAETTYYRWRQRHDPAQVDTDRRCRESSSSSIV